MTPKYGIGLSYLNIETVVKRSEPLITAAKAENNQKMRLLPAFSATIIMGCDPVFAKAFYKDEIGI